MRNLFNKTKQALAFFVIISILIINLPQVTIPVQAKIEQPKYEQSFYIESKSLDTRALILKEYLSLKDSPMQNNAQDFIEAADKHGVDWKLVPAIAGVESTFGKQVPGGTNPQNSSFNAYGWGVYGTQAIYFKSWRDGIYTLNQGLKENYINKGLINPYSINRVYAASPTWGEKVSYFMGDLDQYAQKYNKNLENSRLGDILSIRQIPVTPRPSTMPMLAVIAFK